VPIRRQVTIEHRPLAHVHEQRLQALGLCLQADHRVDRVLCMDRTVDGDKDFEHAGLLE